MGADVDATASGEGAGMFSEGRVSLLSAYLARALVCEWELYPLGPGWGELAVVSNLLPFRESFAQISGTAAGNALHRPDSTRSTRRPVIEERTRDASNPPRDLHRNTSTVRIGDARELPAEINAGELGVLTSIPAARWGAVRGIDRGSGGPSREVTRRKEPGGRSRDSPCRSSASARR